MKKITLLAAVVIAVSFASCRKDKTCTCTSVTSGTGYSYTSVTVIKAKSTKKDATAWCSGAQSATSTTNGVANTGGSAETCVVS